MRIIKTGRSNIQNISWNYQRVHRNPIELIFGTRDSSNAKKIKQTERGNYYSREEIHILKVLIDPFKDANVIKVLMTEKMTFVHATC